MRPDKPNAQAEQPANRLPFGSPMRPDDYARYSRIQAACLAMAKQSVSPEVQARWFALAEAWLKRATEVRVISVSGRQKGSLRPELSSRRLTAPIPLSDDLRTKRWSDRRP